MAKVIIDETQPQLVQVHYSWWRIALFGAGLGIIFWVLTWLVGHFVIDPLVCGATAAMAQCSDSLATAGNITTVLTALIAVFALIRLGIARPLLVVVASAVMLWGLASWTNGMVWGEVAAWSAVLYALNYVLFSWINRYIRFVPVVIAIVIVVVIARILIAL